MANPTEDREIVTSRVIDAPRELVFAAFTEKEHVEQWWGAGGVTTTEWNAKPGGLWRYSQRGAQFRITFVEIDKPRRLVYDFGDDVDDAPDPVRTHVTFEDEDGKTKVTLQLRFASAAAREQAAQYGAVAGATQALEGLAEYVANV
jgi:uncharacterized protein YndB with AHSA1/START domain